MEKNKVLLSTCLVVLLGITAYYFFDGFLDHRYTKSMTIVGNLLIIGLWASVLIKNNESIAKSSYLGLTVLIAANLYFGVYLKEYFYTFTFVLTGVFEFFRRTK